MKQQDFEAYIRQIEPSAQESANAWKTAIGLQAVDGLKPSSYLLETARRNIEGDITIEEVRELLDTYYRSKLSVRYKTKIRKKQIKFLLISRKSCHLKLLHSM